MDKNLFLLPLSQEEVLALLAIIAAALATIDTARFQNEMQKNLMMTQKSHLESVKNKLTKVR